jgi:hypothetical protein
VVKALRSNGAHKPFGKGIRIRSPEWRSEDLGILGLERFVEARHVLLVTVADQELGRDVGVGEIAGDVPGLLGNP